MFRTRCAEQTNVERLQELGTYKFVCVKKVEKNDDDDDIIKEHSTTTFGELMNKRKEKVIAKETKSLKQLKRKGTDESKYSEPIQEQPVSINKTEESPKKSEREETNFKEKYKPQVQFRDQTLEVEDNFNEAFVTPMNGGTSPRIPEISSVLCCEDQDDDDSVELAIPSEIRTDDSTLFSRREEDQGGVLEPLPKIDFRRRRENKSMTAVCSFEFGGPDDGSDTESETDSDEDDDVRNNKTDKLIGELSNIDKTFSSTTNQQLTAEAADETDENAETENKAGRYKTKTKDKPKMGKLLKDLTRTTTSASMRNDCPSKTDAKYQEAKENIKEEKRKAKSKESQSKKQKSVKNKGKEKSHVKTGSPTPKVGKSREIRDSIEYVTQDTGFSLDFENFGFNDSEEEENADVVDEENKESVDKVSEQEDAVSNFDADDSSTDGDDVEMIYQKHDQVEKLDDIEDGNEVGVTDDSKNTVETLGQTNRALSPINVVSRPKSALLTMGMSNVKPLYQPSVMTNLHVDIVEDVFDLGEGANNSNNNIEAPGSKWNVKKRPIIRPNTSMSFSVSEVQSTDFEEDLDLADIDEDGNAITVPTEHGGRTMVPPLKLNYQAALAKKAKRPGKRQNSNMKYLGSSVPAKSKQPPR